jgi:hypothetical protein
MKKIINGKLYNTETAQLIASYSNTGDTRDFSRFSEELYQKKTGEYFLYGEGGPMTKYSRSCGQNSWSGDENIEPLTDTAAKAWAEEYMDADDFMGVFGPVEE